MQFSARSIQQYSDRRLLNVVIYRDRYSYPFDYVELCKDELRRRGYTNADITAAIQYATTDHIEAGLPQRFELKARLASRKKLLLRLAISSVFLFALLFLFGNEVNEPFRRIIAGIAIACMCACFLIYATMSILKGQLARLNAADYHNLYTS